MPSVIIETEVSDAEDIAEECAGAGYTVYRIPPLYHIPDESGIWPELAGVEGQSVVLSTMNPRPAEWILRSHGLGGGDIHAIQVSAEDTPSELSERIGELAGPGSSDDIGSVVDLSEPVEERWYPVIDYSRCESCGACFQFCIFGVYEREDDGRVSAVEPDNCKAGCPACARICPNSAIMFPLCDDSAIAGAPGEFVQPDEGARRMYYMRTGAECSECGGSGEFDPPSNGSTCSECGRPMEDENTDDVVLSEIDTLIEELDDMAGGGEQ